jgi:hypothetical protein
MMLSLHKSKVVKEYESNSEEDHFYDEDVDLNTIAKLNNKNPYIRLKMIGEMKNKVSKLIEP